MGRVNEQARKNGRPARATGVVVEIRIAGIPCLAEVHSYHEVKGSYSYNAPSDMDYHGYVEMGYTILDRRGYPAKWLSNKLTPQIRAEIEEAIIAAHN